MLEVFEPEALNYFTFFCPILSTLSAFRNPILTPLSLSGFLSSLLCALIAPTLGLTFCLLIPRTLAVALSFSSGKAYPFLNFLPPLFLCLILTLDYVGINISLNNSSSVSFLNVYAPLFAPPQRMAEPILSLPPLEISSFWRTSISITPSGTQEVHPTHAGRRYLTGSFLLTSSLSMTLTHPLFFIVPLAVALSLTSPLPFPAPGRCYRT